MGVVEIDITNPSVPKLPIYALFGAPEVWRYDGTTLQILMLEGDGYAASVQNRALNAMSPTAQVASAL